ncbi:Thioesterase/thiol ester dehydrase-isomerase [Lojkania enalia]|uniref:Thioesterase/thiol ester dehydrase-isomerase n=1 Tax=Lojkania enalia TaxID=147567 RepID=A0A9P4KBE5_9PLEO|nr:Thioesterase/thiol ester dehydrase-isomerase [Didymosphaeria enalia]
MSNHPTKYASTFQDKNHLTPFEKVKLWFEIAGEEGYEGHDKDLSTHLTLLSATRSPTPSNPHSCTTLFSLVVPKSLCNMAGALHGGAVALIFDICTSTAITACSNDDSWSRGHVSRTLNCTYLRPAVEGQKVFVESQVVHLGKRLAQVRGEMRTEDGKVCYLCEHGKVAVGGERI